MPTAPTDRKSSLKVVFAWPTISGYMAACWRALAEQSGIDLFVVAFEAGRNTAFDDGLMEGIPSRQLGPDERHEAKLVRDLVVEQNPDVLVLSGWFHSSYRRLPFRRALHDVRFVMKIDAPWRGSLES